MVDPRYMDRALQLAALGGRSVMPNPMVGAVLVYDAAIIGEGHHEAYGSSHAEVNAIRSVADRSKLSRATLYVTLEPCSHFGKTPPCADLIVESGIPAVVVGCRDPFPEVCGKGIERLRNAGVQVTEMIGHRECTLLNKRFVLAHRLERPYVILKWAQTSDGFIARSDGSSKWISCGESRTLTHQWRAQEMSILVGTATARVDDPNLTVRLVNGPNPVRVVIDASLSLPTHLNIFNREAETIVFNAHKEHRDEHMSWQKIDFGQPIVPQILSRLYERKLISLIVEGGAQTLRSFIDAGLWDEARVFVSPHQFGSGISAPKLPTQSSETHFSGDDTLMMYSHQDLESRLGL